METKVFVGVKGLIVKSGKILVVKERIKDYEYWDLPGGRVKYGHSPLETLKRELEEETKLKVDIIKPIGMYYFFRSKTDNWQVVLTAFLCKLLSKKIDIHKNPDETENIIEFKWVDPKEFLKPDFEVAHKSLKELIVDYFKLK